MWCRERHRVYLPCWVWWLFSLWYMTSLCSLSVELENNRRKHLGIYLEDYTIDVTVRKKPCGFIPALAQLIWPALFKSTGSSKNAGIFGSYIENHTNPCCFSTHNLFSNKYSVVFWKPLKTSCLSTSSEQHWDWCEQHVVCTGAGTGAARSTAGSQGAHASWWKCKMAAYSRHIFNLFVISISMF